jgi:outer membrane protein assembly factor BamB
MLVRCLIAFALVAVAPALAEDWAHMHGPRMDGLPQESGIQPKMIKQLWKTNVGTGFSSIAVSNGLLYTMGNLNEFDVVLALDANTGKAVWRKSYACALSPNSYEGGPNAMPTVHGGKVYTVSKEGHLHCFDAKTGQIVWKRHANEFGASPPSWGFAGPATIHGELALYNVGDGGLALNKDTGEPVWKTSGDGAGYAPPVPFPLSGGGTGFAIFRTPGLLAVDPATGKEIWSHEWVTGANVNAATPLYHDGKFFLSSSYDKGCCMIDVSSGSPKELWRNKNMRNHFSTSAWYKGHIYGMDGHTGSRSSLVCLDPATGQKVWKKELGFGSMRLADGKLIVLLEDGELIFAEASTTGYLELARKRILGFKCWTVPTISNGRLYARNAPGDLVAYSLSGN